MKRKWYFLTLFLFLCTICSAQNYTLPLWSGSVPNFQKTDEVETRDTTSSVLISYVQQPDIAVFLPSKEMANGQAVVICPGGGYGFLSYDKEGTDVAKWLNSKGIAGIVLKYRLPNSKSNIVRNKSPLLDAQRALRLTRFHAKEWNVDVDKVGIMGFSAGGHLASTAGTHFDSGNDQNNDPVESFSSRPDFMILIYPVISFDEKYTHKGSRVNLIGENPDPEMIKYYSNELQVTKDTPPTFLIHSGDDRTVAVENSLLFYKSLISNGIRAEMHIYPEGGHGYGLAVGRGYLSSWPERCADWLNGLNIKK